MRWPTQHLPYLDRPAPAPNNPCLVERPEVLAVVRDERLPAVSGKGENLGVTPSQAAELFCRFGILSVSAEQAREEMRDIFVKRKPEDGHALPSG